MGPRSSLGRGRQLSTPRAELLDTLRAQSEPTTLNALASAVDSHPNTVREHLDGLVAAGLVTRFAAAPSGRGRPAWLYEAVTHDSEPPSEYAGLAAALARSIHQRSATPVEDALAAGTDWGRDLAARITPEPERTATAARRRVVDLLGDMGFAPQGNASATSVRLTRCPLLEAAHQYPDVVCSVHLGLARGALEQFGADPYGTDLLPFAEPGACRLRLGPRRS